MSMRFDEESRWAPSLVWLAAALIVLLVAAGAGLRLERIADGEVGVLLNRWTGTLTAVPRPGRMVHCAPLSKLYVLDRTVQTLAMVAEGAAAVRTADGNEALVDVMVQYRIMPAKAAVVVQDFGPAAAYKQSWISDWLRQLVSDSLGELTADQLQNAVRRSRQIEAARTAANAALEPHGIQVDSLAVPTRPRFSADYEAQVARRTQAEQQLRQAEGKILAAQQRLETAEVVAANRKDLAVEQHRGETERLVIQAEAECYRLCRDADAYAERVALGAEGALYQKSRGAEALLATKQAEAEGLAALGKALAGEGGRNLVKLEYAQRLKGLVITGQPAAGAVKGENGK